LGLLDKIQDKEMLLNPFLKATKIISATNYSFSWCNRNRNRVHFFLNKNIFLVLGWLCFGPYVNWNKRKSFAYLN
jgi:hypothetical protein